MIAVLSLLACIPWAAPPEFGPLPPNCRLQDGAYIFESGEQGTADQYLLTKQPFRDFIFQFTLTRLRNAGDRERALVTFARDPDKAANRRCFFLPVTSFAPGRPQRVRLIVLGGHAVLTINGEKYGSDTSYGRPPEAGLVGLLHYYDYALEYRAFELQPLTPDRLPRPRNLRAQLTPAGCVRLTWQEPPGLEGLFRYVVFRSGGAARSVHRPKSLFFLDRDTRRGATYEYRVALAVGEDQHGPEATARVKVTQVKPPALLEAARAVLRLDDSVRLHWRLPADSRGRAVSIYRAAAPLAAIDLRTQTPLARAVPLTQTSFLAPPGKEQHFTLVLEDPDDHHPALAHVRAEPTAPVVQPGRPFPRRHPYLLHTATDLAALRARAKTDTTAHTAIEQVRARADGYLKTPFVPPGKPSNDQRSVTPRLQQLGLAYALTREEKYAKYVRDALVAYADIYPTFPPRAGRARMTTSSGLFEATWFVPLVLAYDYTYDSSAYTAPDRKHIEQDLLRLGVALFKVDDYSNRKDPRVGDLHYKCYNFQAWFDACVGLVGLLLKDGDLFEYAIDGPYGFKHLLAHDVQDDGLFWERSLGYHSFVLYALAPLLEAAWHCNLDLYNLTVPDDYNEDREDLANYCVGDGDNGPKSLKLMYDAPFYFMFPDRSYAVVADSSRGPLSGGSRYLTAWHRIRDPKYAWLYNLGRKALSGGELYRGVKDASASVRLAYDDQFLYVGALIADDVVRNTHRKPSEVWAGDALWIGLKWRGELGGPYDFIYGLSPGDLDQVPPVPALFNRFELAHNGPSTGRLAVRPAPEGYSLEFAVPWSEFVPRGGEEGRALRPAAGDAIALDLCVYDGDRRDGPSVKEKMLGWSCHTDRYDSAQGGKLFWGPDSQAPQAGKVVAVPRAPKPLHIDGDLADWDTLPCRAAVIGPGSAVMTDAGSGPDLSALLLGEIPQDAGSFAYTDGKFCNNGVLRRGCSWFPSSGFAVLRETPGPDGLPDPDSVAVNFNCGPHGGGHGHSDQLSLVVYARRKHWLPDFGSCPYESKEKGLWTAQTISHNTVVVDGVSQLPTGDRNVTWPCDTASSQNRGHFDFFFAAPLMALARGHSSSVYPGVRLQRTVALVGGKVLDFFRVSSDTEHVYDYPLHIDGECVESSVPLAAQQGALGEKAGYQFITDLRTADVETSITTSWQAGGAPLRLTCQGGEGTHFFVGRSITNNLDRLMPMALLRRRAKSTIFQSLIEPPGSGAPAECRWLSSDTATGVRLKSSNRDVLFALALGKEPASLESLSFRGACAAAAFADGRPNAVLLVRGTSASWGDLQLSCDAPADVQVTRRSDGRLSVTVGLRPVQGLRIRVGRGRHTVHSAGHRGAKQTKVKCRQEWLTFEAASDGSYLIE